ncbi:MAG: ABC transporter ATP-binding protein [Anaerolineales bacterium]|nr:ABC transporter ATP-binding protein [Anaerolineales bacterium]
MDDVAIRVENLSKRYQLGHAQQRHDTLRDQLVAGLKAPIQRLRVGRSAAQADDTLWALKDVSFDVKRGEVVGIIGRNGAGKSTLLKILSRITEPTSGRAVINGRVGSLLEVGTGFHPELTGRENIYLNGAILGMRRAEIDRKFDEIVAFSEIEKFLDTPVKRYSSGMYVRLAFAVAAHLEPEILLVDEVLAVGDAAFQNKCLGKMANVARSGRTVFFVSHNMNAIQKICDRGVLLGNGKVIADEKAKRVVELYLEQLCAQGKNGPTYISDLYRDITLLVNNKVVDGIVVWKNLSPIKFSLLIESIIPVVCPRIDVSFYTTEALKLFAIRGDDVLDRTQQAQNTHWRVDFVVEKAALAQQKLFIDIGLRNEHHGNYTVLWQHACELIIDADGKGEYVAPDSLLLPEISMQITN